MQRPRDPISIHGRRQRACFISMHGRSSGIGILDAEDENRSVKLLLSKQHRLLD